MKTEQRVIRIGDWRVEPAACRISRGDITEKLEPKVMALLVYLAERPGDVVSRQELEDNVWKGMVVGYDSLSRAIIKLRKAFGDDSKHPSIIETISKRGYRLIAEVTIPDDSTHATDGGEDTIRTFTESRGVVSPQRRLSIITFAIVVVAVIVWFKPWPEFKEPIVEQRTLNIPDKPSIAVLPFSNMSDDSEHEYFSDGITEDIITDLSKISGLFVIARNSTFEYRHTPADIREVASELGVRYILEGSVRKDQNRVRINAQLIDATTGGHTWADRYDGKLDNVFDLQDKVTQKIIAALSVQLTAGEQFLPHRKMRLDTFILHQPTQHSC